MKLLDLGSKQAAASLRQAHSDLPCRHVCLQRHSHARSQRRRQSFIVATSSGLTSSVQLGPSTSDDQPSSSSANGAAASIDAIALDSEAGVDYSQLRDHLKEGEFEKADDDTRALLIQLAGPDAEKRGWVYFSEVKFIPEVDLQTMDSLWKAASGNKFGYSVQRELWLQNKRRWDRFFKQIDWVQGENNNYRKWPKEFMYNTDAAKGHLPLTNALRGTQLFKAIMEHPAFTKSANASPDWLK